MILLRSGAREDPGALPCHPHYRRELCRMGKFLEKSSGRPSARPSQDLTPEFLTQTDLRAIPSPVTTAAATALHIDTNRSADNLSIALPREARPALRLGRLSSASSRPTASCNFAPATPGSRTMTRLTIDHTSIHQ